MVMELYLLLRPAADTAPPPRGSIWGEMRAKSSKLRPIEGMVSMTVVLTFCAAPVRDWLMTGLGAVTVTATSILACSRVNLRLRLSLSFRMMSVIDWGPNPGMVTVTV